MRALAIVLALAATPAVARPFNHRPAVASMRRDFESGDPVAVAKRTDKAIGALVRAAARAAEDRGAPQLAARWVFEYEQTFSHFLELSVMQEGVGDHKPLSEFLELLYLELESVLGPKLMELFHFDDIRIFNFTIPVVFAMKDHLGEVIDEPEYALHWTPFCGVVAYWSVWLSCEIATYGSGWFLICTPAGMIGEKVTVKWIAPPLADNAWRLFWGRASL